MKSALAVLAILLLLASPVRGQVGMWQGTERAGPQPLRIKLAIARSADGGLAATLWSVDETGFDVSFAADTVLLEGSTLTVALTPYHVRYVGTVHGSDSIKGTWTEEGRAQPLDLVRANAKTEWLDKSPHRGRMVNVEKAVTLETLDWGGSGAPVVLLAGAGNTAHVFDDFAPKLTDHYHVYGITRRGFGRSSVPTSGYLADSLGDDVVAVIDSLAIQRPVLIGHSIAGEELSSIGSRHPERVAGLVYLDAGYQYAFYDSAQVLPQISIRDVRHKLERLLGPPNGISPRARQEMIAELLDTALPQLERDLRSWKRDFAALPNQDVAMAPAIQSSAAPVDPLIAIRQLLSGGTQKYTSIRAPVLAIFAAPHEVPAALRDSLARARFDSSELARLLPQIRAFERGVPSARVVTLPHAHHYVFRSNEADVLREIRSFVDGLRTK